MIVSNFIRNFPPTQLLIGPAWVLASAAPGIAADVGLAGNLGPFASFANILALQMAANPRVSVKRIVLPQFAIGLVALVPALLAGSGPENGSAPRRSRSLRPGFAGRLTSSRRRQRTASQPLCRPIRRPGRPLGSPSPSCRRWPPARRPALRSEPRRAS